MFEKFPKTRPTLPPRVAEIYEQYYIDNRQGGNQAASLAQKMERWLHRHVAADVVAQPAVKRSTLELGAGTLNQFPHEPVVGPYDIVEPFKSLFADSPLLARVRAIYNDVAEISPETRYDRITSVAVLEHVCDLPDMVARCGLLMADGATFRAAIPNEGTFLWSLGWRMTTGIEFRLRHGVDYNIIMRHEHVNNAQEVEEVLEHFFEEAICKVFGLNKAIGLYRFYECSSPRLERCRVWLDRNQATLPQNN